MDKVTDDPTSWVTISEAASRLGLSPFGVRSRIRRGTLRAKLGNDGRRLVGIPADHLADHPLSNSTGNSKDDPSGHEVEHWRTVAETARVATSRAEGELAGLREALAAEARRSAELLARADRLEAELADARKSWLERVLEAVRRR